MKKKKEANTEDIKFTDSSDGWPLVYVRTGL
jgi:hypothetical protein